MEGPRDSCSSTPDFEGTRSCPVLPTIIISSLPLVLKYLACWSCMTGAPRAISCLFLIQCDSTPSTIRCSRYARIGLSRFTICRWMGSDISLITTSSALGLPSSSVNHSSILLLAWVVKEQIPSSPGSNSIYSKIGRGSHSFKHAMIILVSVGIKLSQFSLRFSDAPCTSWLRPLVEKKSRTLSPKVTFCCHIGVSLSRLVWRWLPLFKHSFQIKLRHSSTIMTSF